MRSLSTSTTDGTPVSNAAIMALSSHPVLALEKYLNRRRMSATAAVMLNSVMLRTFNWEPMLLTGAPHSVEDMFLAAVR